MKKLLLFVIFVLLLVGSNALAERICVKTNLDDFLAAKDQVLHVSFVSHAGLELLRLKQRDPFAPNYYIDGVALNQSQETSIMLLQGKRRRYNNRKWHPLQGAGAHLVNGNFVIHLIGKRGRAYEVIMPLKNFKKKSCSLARLRHVRRTKAVACADVAHGHSFSEAATSAPAKAANANYFLSLATDADYEYYAKYGSKTNTHIQSILNDAEAIYLSQFNLRFILGSQNYYTDDSQQPYTSNSSSILLQQFRSNIESSDRLGSFDVAHLFTNKSISQGVIGLAYLGTICLNPSFAYSLSKDVNAAFDYITCAHEMGHNFGASHDYGDTSNGPNNSAYAGHVMNAYVSSENSTFSTYSVDEISTFIDSYGSCLEVEQPDLALTVSLKGKASNKKSTFKASLSLTNSLSDCEISLYGARKKSFINNSLDLANDSKIVLINSEDISPNETIVMSKKINNKSSNRKTGYVVAELKCDDSEAERSSIKKVRPYYKSAKKFFKQLAKKFSS